MPVPINFWSVQSMTACWANTYWKKLFVTPSNPVSSHQSAPGNSSRVVWPSSSEASLTLDQPVATRVNADFPVITKSFFQLSGTFSRTGPRSSCFSSLRMSNRCCQLLLQPSQHTCYKRECTSQRWHFGTTSMA